VHRVSVCITPKLSWLRVTSHPDCCSYDRGSETLCSYWSKIQDPVLLLYKECYPDLSNSRFHYFSLGSDVAELSSGMYMMGKINSPHNTEN